MPHQLLVGTADLHLRRSCRPHRLAPIRPAGRKSIGQPRQERRFSLLFSQARTSRYIGQRFLWTRGRASFSRFEIRRPEPQQVHNRWISTVPRGLPHAARSGFELEPHRPRRVAHLPRYSSHASGSRFVPQFRRRCPSERFPHRGTTLFSRGKQQPHWRASELPRDIAEAECFGLD